MGMKSVHKNLTFFKKKTTFAELDEENVDDNDWCAICHDGGDTLYCCDRCPKVYHLFCYIPPLTEEPPDDWVSHFFLEITYSLGFV